MEAWLMVGWLDDRIDGCLDDGLYAEDCIVWRYQVDWHFWHRLGVVFTFTTWPDAAHMAWDHGMAVFSTRGEAGGMHQSSLGHLGAFVSFPSYFFFFFFEHILGRDPVGTKQAVLARFGNRHTGVM